MFLFISWRYLSVNESSASFLAALDPLDGSGTAVSSVQYSFLPHDWKKVSCFSLLWRRRYCETARHALYKDPTTHLLI